MRYLEPWEVEELEKLRREQTTTHEERPRLEVPRPPEDWRPYPEKQERPAGGCVIIINYGE